MLGCGERQVQEMRILDNVVRATSRGIELEGDPRHADLVVKKLKLESAKVSQVPGSKEPAKRITGNSKTTTTSVTMTSRASQASALRGSPHRTTSVWRKMNLRRSWTVREQLHGT